LRRETDTIDVAAGDDVVVPLDGWSALADGALKIIDLGLETLKLFRD
jgi:hypothetical protein